MTARRSALMDRRALFSSAAAATLLAATGVSAAGPRRGGRLRLALSGADRQDTWQRGQGLFMQVARQGLVFDTLTEIAADGTLHGELATRWTAEKDGARWVFDLRKGVHFHDGTPFTAADVEASAAGFEDGDVRATGTHSVAVTLNKPDPALPIRLAAPEYFIAPAHALDAGIGTGLYKVTSFEPGKRLRTARVAEHYKGNTAGWFDEVELTSIPAEPVRAQAMAEYLVDAVDLTSTHALAALNDIRLMPGTAQPQQAVSADLQQPGTVSTLRPLDNLRAAERWWFG